MDNKPSFDDLMVEGDTPRRTPILDHAAVVKSVVEWFQNKSKWRAAETEMPLPQTEPERRADVLAWNQNDREFYIIEAKAGWNDFVRDRKFHDYRKWCNWFAFAVPEELVASALRRMNDPDVPRRYGGVGLLVIPNDFGPRRMVRRPTKYEMPEQTYMQMVERWGKSCWGRLIGARQKIAEQEFDLRRKYNIHTKAQPSIPSPE